MTCSDGAFESQVLRDGLGPCCRRGAEAVGSHLRWIRKITAELSSVFSLRLGSVGVPEGSQISLELSSIAAALGSGTQTERDRTEADA